VSHFPLLVFQTRYQAICFVCCTLGGEESARVSSGGGETSVSRGILYAMANFGYRKLALLSPRPSRDQLSRDLLRLAALLTSVHF
jgi:hypothetical protein